MASTSSPCAGCKYLRRKCSQECVFAPYFPPDQPQKFAIVHKIFGASNTSKLLNELPPHHREDAANSLAYEADARVRDPVHGCVSVISFLEREVARLKQELEDAKSELSRYETSPVASATILVAEPPMHMAVAALQGPSASTSSFHGISMGLALQQQQQQQHQHQLQLQQQQQQQLLPTSSRVDHQQDAMFGHATREQQQAQIIAREKQMLELQLDSHHHQQHQQQCLNFSAINYHQQQQLTRERIMEQMQLSSGGGVGGGITYELGPTSLNPVSASERQFGQIAFNTLWSGRSGSDDSGPSCKAGVSPLSPA